MDTNKALALIQSNPDLQAYIGEIKKKNAVVALGEHEVFALSDKAGDVKAFKRNITLTGEDGTLVRIGKNMPYIISATGYQRINDNTGTTVIFTDTVEVDGQPRDNPAPVYDDHGNLMYVKCRAVAFRLNAMGIPQVRSHTHVFDLRKMKAVDMLAKAKYNGHVLRVLPDGRQPDEEKGAIWAPVPLIQGFTLWCNTAHKDVIGWLQGIVQRESKAFEYAQTFAARNAAMALHGVSVVPGQLGPDGKLVRQIPYWQMIVFCWRPVGGGQIRWDERQYKELSYNVKKITTGELPVLEVDGSQRGIEFQETSDVTSAHKDAEYQQEIENIERKIQEEDEEPIEVSGKPVDENPVSKEPQKESIEEEPSFGGDDNPPMPEDAPPERGGQQQHRGQQNTQQRMDDPGQKGAAAGQKLSDDMKKVVAQFNEITSNQDMTPYLNMASTNLNIRLDTQDIGQMKLILDEVARLLG